MTPIIQLTHLLRDDISILPVNKSIRVRQEALLGLSNAISSKLNSPQSRQLFHHINTVTMPVTTHNNAPVNILRQKSLRLQVHIPYRRTKYLFFHRQI